MKLIDLTGRKFGRLTVVGRAENKIQPNKSIKTMWICDCSCGNKNIIVLGHNLKNSHTKSCGCLNSEVAAERNKKYNIYDLSGDYGIGYTSKGKEFYFDLEDYDLIKNYCWCVDIYGYIYANSLNKDNSMIKQHRIIMKTIDKQQFVDHKNHKKYDNRKCNLRVANSQNNSINKKILDSNTSGVTGVYWSTQRNKWIAQIVYNNKCINLGGYSDFDEAVKVRKSAEEKYFGEWSFDNSRGIDVNTYVTK